MVTFSPSRCLAALGRQSATAIAASVFIGLALPGLAAWAKPLLVPTILSLLTLAFLRSEASGLFSLHRAGTVALATGWIMLLLPTALGLALSALVPDGGPVVLALMLHAAAPPIMSAPAFALVLGLDSRLVLMVMVAAMAVTPISAPILVEAFSASALHIDALGLAWRLGAVLLGTALAGLLLRLLATPRRVGALREHLDGANVLLLTLLAVGLMDGVTARFLAQPGLVLGLTALAFAVSLAGLLVTALLFRAIGGGDALMLGFAAGHRNMSVMIAAAGTALPQETWLYVAVAQFPIYLLPLVLRPIARRLRAGAAG